MNTYYKDESEAEESGKIVAITMQLFSGRKNKRLMAEKHKACHHFGFLEYSYEDKNRLICPTSGSRIPAEQESG